MLTGCMYTIRAQHCCRNDGPSRPLRLLEDDEARRTAALEAPRGEVRKGLASGKGKPAEDVLARLERKYAGMARRQLKK